MVALKPDQRIALDTALDLLSPASELVGKSPHPLAILVHVLHAAPIDDQALERSKLTTSLIGREWLWNKLILWVRSSQRSTLLLLAESGGPCAFNSVS